MFLGSGTYGSVYTRLPFHDEKLEDVRDLKEASKIFHCDDTYTVSAGVIHRLSMCISPEVIEELKKYFLLPIRFGRINLTSPIPYHKNSPLLWKGDSIYHEAKNKFLTQQITYPLGKPLFQNSLFEYHNVYELYNKTLYVLEGINLLHSHDIVHTDVKLPNIVDVDGVWKMADSGELYHVSYKSADFRERKYIMSENFTYIYYSPYVYWLVGTPTITEYIELMDRNYIRHRHGLCTRIETPLIRNNILELEDNEWLELADRFYIIKNYVCCGTLLPDKPYNNTTLEYLNMISISELFDSSKPTNPEILKKNDLYGLGFFLWCVIDEYMDEEVDKKILYQLVMLAMKLTLPVLPTF